MGHWVRSNSKAQFFKLGLFYSIIDGLKDQIWKPWIYLENVILGTTVVGEKSSLQIVQTGPEQSASVKNANE